jgi:hypothetical protein
MNWTKWLPRVLLAGLFLGTGAVSASSPPLPATIVTLSGRADMVSGGSSLVEIRLPAGARSAALRVVLNGADVTAMFRTRADGRTLGVVTGLRIGANRLEVRAGDNSFRGARLTLTNHPIGGPVILASQISPWICAAPVPSAGDDTTPAINASGLSTPAYDAQCNIRTEVHYFYRTLSEPARAEGGGGCRMVLPDPSPALKPEAKPTDDACFQPYIPGVTPDAAVARVKPQGSAGQIPYIVRVERGTINRGIFDIAVLFDPGKRWTAIEPQAQWNGKIIYSFGASTGVPRLQYRSEQNWADDSALSRGFMVVDNSMTDSAYNANRLLVAETVMMMKEYVAKNYGEIRYVLGNGCSGGALNQNVTASMFPGLLDGLQLQCTMADSTSNAMEVSDCFLLVRAYASPAWQALMQREGLGPDQIAARKTAINGQLDQKGCHNWHNSFGYMSVPGQYVRDLVTGPGGKLVRNDKSQNNCKLPPSMVYDRARNPGGARCTYYDNAVALWGKVPGTNRAAQPYDNVGVQYGWRALLAGTITPEEFVTINELVGGRDGDGNPVARRSVADPQALVTAYLSGAVTDGAQLARLPIIDLRGYDESGIHFIWKTFAERDRIRAAAGSYGNHVVWRFGATMRAPAPLAEKAFLEMDKWLSALPPKARLNDARIQAQLVAAKPSTLFDLCYLSGDASLADPVRDIARCDSDPRLAIHSFPREVAGGARIGNVLKCRLKPLRVADYGRIAFTAKQWARLRTVFVTGVCDWSKRGIGQQPAQTPRTYVAGPGGKPLPPEPVSIPL